MNGHDHQQRFRMLLQNVEYCSKYGCLESTALAQWQHTPSPACLRLDAEQGTWRGAYFDVTSCRREQGTLVHENASILRSKNRAAVLDPERLTAMERDMTYALYFQTM